MHWTDYLRREFAERYDGFSSWEQLAEIRAALLQEAAAALDEEEFALREGMARDLAYAEEA